MAVTKKATTGSTSSESYEVLVGINYGPASTRAEAGEIVTGLPAKSIPWLLDQQIIRPAKAAKAKAAKPVSVVDVTDSKDEE